jgi:hypothetical protein
VFWLRNELRKRLEARFTPKQTERVDRTADTVCPISLVCHRAYHAGSSFCTTVVRSESKSDRITYFSNCEVSRSEVTGADVCVCVCVCRHVIVTHVQELLVATAVKLACLGGSCRRRARMLTARPLQSRSVCLSQLFLRLPLRPRVAQTDVRWAAARSNGPLPHSSLQNSARFFLHFFPSGGGKKGSEVGWGGGQRPHTLPKVSVIFYIYVASLFL